MCERDAFFDHLSPDCCQTHTVRMTQNLIFCLLFTFSFQVHNYKHTNMNFLARRSPTSCDRRRSASALPRTDERRLTERELQRVVRRLRKPTVSYEVSRYFVCLFSLLLNVPFHTLVHFRDGSAQTILRAASLRQKLQIKAFHLTQSQYTDTGPTSPRADPITPGAWQGSHWNANV